MPLAWFICTVLHLQFSYKSNIDPPPHTCVYVCVYVCIYPFVLPLRSPLPCVLYVRCLWRDFLPTFPSIMRIRENVILQGLRGALAEAVNKSLLLLPAMSCQVHTSSQHIIINCTLNYSVQLSKGGTHGEGERNGWGHSSLQFLPTPRWDCSIICVCIKFVDFSPHIWVHLLLRTAPQLHSFISVFIFLGTVLCTYTGEVSTFLLPFSDALMGNVLMHGYVSLEASHFRPWLCQVNTLIKDKKYVVWRLLWRGELAANTFPILLRDASGAKHT